MKGGYKDGPRCDQYTMLVADEKKAIEESVKELKYEELRQQAQEIAQEIAAERHEDEEFARGPLGQHEF